MTWVALDEVLGLVGASATAANVAHANSDVTVYANRTPSASAGMNARDLYWLKLAAAYQAVWLGEQVNVDARQSVRSFAQDGMSVNYDGEWQVVLAPMAARSLRNVSWKGTRTERPAPDPAAVLGTGFLEEEHDDEHEWHPLTEG